MDGVRCGHAGGAPANGGARPRVCRLARGHGADGERRVALPPHDDVPRGPGAGSGGAGADSLDEKRDKLLGFSDGRYRVLITKPSIAGFGMNWQHCARMAFVGPSHSYEQTYQAIRRCWRFGQSRPVHVHTMAAETEAAVVLNYARKERDASKMAEETAAIVGPSMRAAIAATDRRWNPYNPTQKMEVPPWLS